MSPSHTIITVGTGISVTITQNTITDIKHINNFKISSILKFNFKVDVWWKFLKEYLWIPYFSITKSKTSNYLLYPTPRNITIHLCHIMHSIFLTWLLLLKGFLFHYSFPCFKLKPHCDPILHQRPYFTSNTTQFKHTEYHAWAKVEHVLLRNKRFISQERTIIFHVLK